MPRMSCTRWPSMLTVLPGAMWIDPETRLTSKCPWIRQLSPAVFAKSASTGHFPGSNFRVRVRVHICLSDFNENSYIKNAFCIFEFELHSIYKTFAYFVSGLTTSFSYSSRVPNCRGRGWGSFSDIWIFWDRF